MKEGGKRKTLFVITKSNWGGAQRYVYDLATGLPKDQFIVQVAFGQPGRLAEELKKAGIATHPIQALQRDLSFAADVKSFFELWRLFRKERPDIVHLNSSKAAGLGALAARLAGVPRIIFTAHGWPFWEKRGPLAQAIIYFLSWLTAIFSHTVITISDYDLRVAKRMPFIKGKAVRIYNGLASIVFLPKESHTGIRVLTNAELTHNKNLFLAIDAVAQAKDAGAPLTYSIMSTGELREDLEQYVKEKNLEDTVSFLGFVPEGSRHYSNFDIFFLPSKKEGVPYVILEAGLAGLPVVASNVGGIPEIIEHGKSGFLCDPSDTATFAAFLTRLAHSPEDREKLGVALKEKVESVFSLSRMLEETMVLYRI